MAGPRGTFFLGQIPAFAPEADEERSDYRAVPASDTGDGYSDRGMLGSYSPSETPFRDPPDVAHFAGFGATEEDIERGYCEPSIRNDPAYAINNYHQRSSLPRASNVAPGETDMMMDDFEFRARNQRSRGFLTRPRIPTERG